MTVINSGDRKRIFYEDYIEILFECRGAVLIYSNVSEEL